MAITTIESTDPGRGGNTDVLCDEFMIGASQAGHEVEKVFLRDKTIHCCTGCSTCSLHGKPCPQKDDAAEVVSQMVAADVIVLATGAEGEEASEQLAHVFDNLMGFLDCLENPVVKGKILATGVWQVGEIKGNPAMAEAYEMGKSIL